MRSRLFLIKLLENKTFNSISSKKFLSFNGFLFLISSLNLLINLYTYLMFNLSYPTDDFNLKNNFVLCCLAINVLPIYNLFNLTLRLVFNLKKFKNQFKFMLKFDLNEMIKFYFYQEFIIQLYYLAFVWINRYLSISFNSYGI